MNLAATAFALLALFAFADNKDSTFKGNEETGRALKKEFHTFRKKMQGFEKEITGKATPEEKEQKESLSRQGKDFQKALNNAGKKVNESR